jgi:hypothetical protein
MKYWMSYVVSFPGGSPTRDDRSEAHQARAHDFPAAPTEGDIKKFQDQVQQELQAMTHEALQVRLGRDLDPSIWEGKLKHHKIVVIVIAFSPLRDA